MSLNTLLHLTCEKVVTAKIKLQTTPLQLKTLRQTKLAYRESLNAVSRYVFEHGKMSNAVRLQYGMQKCIPFLDGPIRSQRTQGASRKPQMGVGLIQDQFHMPTLMGEHRKFFGWIPERVQQRGHQSMVLLARSGNTRGGKRVTDDAHQHALTTLVILILVDVRQIRSIAQMGQRFEQNVAFQAPQDVASTGSQGQTGLTGMKATIPQDQKLFPFPALQQQAQALGLRLSTRTDLGIANQVRRAFYDQDQPRLREGAV